MNWLLSKGFLFTSVDEPVYGRILTQFVMKNRPRKARRPMTKQEIVQEVERNHFCAVPHEQLYKIFTGQDIPQDEFCERIPRRFLYRNSPSTKLPLRHVESGRKTHYPPGHYELMAFLQRNHLNFRLHKERAFFYRGRVLFSESP